MFHVVQAGSRAEGRAIPAKGLTGSGYDGHAFWDTETFVLPMLIYSVPHAARDALRWRHATIGMARERAAQLGLEGAAFPWRTIRGEECSGYWPAGTAAFHVNADIANATALYLQATGDEDFAALLRARDPGRDGAAVAVARPPRRQRRLSHRRGHRPGRVHGDRRQQRLHQPRRAAQPARRGRPRRTAAGARPHARGRRGGGGRLARRRRPDEDPVRRRARGPSAVGGLHRPRALGLRLDPGRELPAVPALPLLRHLPQAGDQAGGPGPGAAPVRRLVHRRRRRRATSTTTSR